MLSLCGSNEINIISAYIGKIIHFVCQNLFYASNPRDGVIDIYYFHPSYYFLQK